MQQPLWAWGILGLILLAVEMATGTFYLLWLGIAALCMSMALWLFPSLPVALQLFMFAALSISSLAIWKLNYKPAPKLRVGQSKGEEIGRQGIVTEIITSNQPGRVAFAQGVMGSRDWAAVAEAEISPGTEIVIVGIEGNMLRVKPKHPGLYNPGQ